MDFRRRQILMDMGIDLLWLRTDGAVQDEKTDAEPRARAIEPVRDAEAPNDPPPTPATPPGAGKPAQIAAGKSARATEPPRSPDPAEPPPIVDSFSVTCTVLDAVMFVREVDAENPHHRFAADLLAAVAGNWRERGTAVSFNWPVGNLSTGEESARKAVRAFVEKQIQDHSPRTVLVTQSVVDRAAGNLAADSVVCADLVEMAGDEAAKRDLWRRLSR